MALFPASALMVKGMYRRPGAGTQQTACAYIVIHKPNPFANPFFINKINDLCVVLALTRNPKQIKYRKRSACG